MGKRGGDGRLKSFFDTSRDTLFLMRQSAPLGTITTSSLSPASGMKVSVLSIFIISLFHYFISLFDIVFLMR